MPLNARMIEAAHARMVSDRTNFDSLWGEIATLVLPRQDVIFSGGIKSSTFRQWQTPEAVMHDPYAAQALADGVSAFEGFVMPRGQRWQKLEIPDESLMRKVKVRQWLEMVETRLFRLRNDPMSGFTSAVHESATSLFAFGAQSTYVQHRRSSQTGKIIGLSYQSEFIGDIFIEVDAEGYPMRIYRQMTLTAEAALKHFGDDLQRAENVYKAAMDSTGNRAAERFTFLHVIEPNMRMMAGRIDAEGMPWLMGYYSESDKVVFKEGGSYSLPRTVSRFERTIGSAWGSCPTMQALPVIRQLQAMTLDMTIAAEMDLKRPLLAESDAEDNVALELRPYGVTWGGLENGRRVFEPMYEDSDPQKAVLLMEQAHQMIDRVFYRDLLQLNREYKSHVSAARVMEEVAEKGLLLSPLARQEDEWLSRQTMRELALMEEAGMLDDTPGEVLEYFDAAGAMDIRYDNTISHMQEAGKSVAYLNLAQQVGLIAQFDPNAAEDFKREFPPRKVLPELARIAGVPASMQATDEERAAYDAEKQAQVQQQQLLEAVPALAGAARDLSAADGQGELR
jgi:hypothetical protein